MSLRRRRPGLVYPVNEDWHYVGEVGEPAFENGWGNVNTFPKLAFRIRETGVVDIQGTVSVSGGSFDPIFTLPAGYRPSGIVTITTLGNVPSCAISVAATGEVQFAGASALPAKIMWITGQFFISSPAVATSGTGYGGNTGAFFAYRAVTVDTTLTDADGTVDASGTITITLLSAAAVADGHTVTIKNTGAGTVTIDGDGAETIDGSLTQTLIPGESITVVSTGSNWIIV